MAEATRTEKQITSTEIRVTLELSAEEYTYLRGLIGDQPSTDGNGASGHIWEALRAPEEGPVEPDTFRVGDRVTVAADAHSAGGSPLGIHGAAVVTRDLDEEGDFFVRFEGDGDLRYVLPRYLSRR
ncbi:hypothetical protein ACFYMO_00745 [Streptomyces sp. NPDC007025]|uniref:hypothetical protein n=1 Tax=Streptomyces sp. NPDC007025 TaxID=3364771 RepID=UPI00368DEC6C